jgi:hypothetical protein
MYGVVEGRPVTYEDAATHLPVYTFEPATMFRVTVPVERTVVVVSDKYV